MRGRKLIPAVAHAIVFFIIHTAAGQPPLEDPVMPSADTLYQAPFLLNERIAERLLEEGRDESSFSEELSSYLEEISSHPVRINHLDDETSDRLLLLSDFQLQAIRNYIRNHGPIRSCAELSLVNGFDEAFAYGIASFIDFTAEDTCSGFREAFSHQRSRHRIAVKSSFALHIDSLEFQPPGNPGNDRIALQARYDFDYGRHLSTSITFEKDPGERFLARRNKIVEPEMLVYTIHLRHLRLGRRFRLDHLILGDFSATFGQGICLSGASTLFSSTDPTNAGRTGNTFKACKYENGKLFGIGTGISGTLSGNIEIGYSTFFSWKHRDARIVGGKYVSLPEDGIHDTPSTLECRRTIGLIAFGNRVNFRRGDLELGLHQLTYRYTRPNGMTPQYWNRLRLFDGWWGNIGADGNYSCSTFRLFAEIAMDFTPALAAVAGCTWYPSGDFSLSGIYRGFGGRYKAPLAVNSGFNSSPDNEQSLEFLADFKPGRAWELRFCARGAYHPFPRYGVRHPSMQGEIRLSAGWKDRRWKIDLYTSTRLRTYRPRALFRGKYTAQVTLSDFDLQSRGGMAVSAERHRRPGWYISAEASWKHRTAGKRMELALTAGITGFDCREWETRGYVYERDLLHTFSSNLLYGRGIRGFLLIGFRNSWIETRIKAGCEVNERQFRIRPVCKLQIILKL